MRKLILHIMVSVDGYIEDADRQMDWHFADAEWDDHIAQLLGSIDGMVFGRVAHALLAQYWPGAGSDPDATPRQREVAGLMQCLPKYVLSTGGYQTDWENSFVLVGDVGAKIQALKAQPGKDLALFAGANAFQGLDALGLVDAYRIVVNPIVLGAGTPLFPAAGRRAKLRLAGVRQLRSGATVLSYDRLPGAHPMG